jgi:hypothetical protein
LRIEFSVGFFHCFIVPLVDPCSRTSLANSRGHKQISPLSRQFPLLID